MKFIELPAVATIGVGHDIHTIARLIGSALGLDATFRHFEPVTGSNRSGRILSRAPTTAESLSFPKEFNRLDVAIELEKLTSQSRYEPLEHPNRALKKGWEICSVHLPNQRGILAWTCWVPQSH